MATPTTIRKAKTAGARQTRQGRLRQNKKLLRWLDSWLATPDDRGETWWTEFQNDLHSHRVTFDPR